jgi:hypothetical protein
LRYGCCRLRRLPRFPSRDFLGFSDFGGAGAARDLKKLWQTDVRPKIETSQTDTTNDTPVVGTIFAQ